MSMPKLPDRSIIRKLVTILDFAGSGGSSTPRDLADRIFAGRMVEFSLFQASKRTDRTRQCALACDDRVTQ